MDIEGVHRAGGSSIPVRYREQGQCVRGATRSRIRYGKENTGRQEQGVAKERSRRSRASDSEEGELPPT